jgi:hypothetical protein
LTPYSFSFLSVLQLPFFSSSNIWANLAFEWFGLSVGAKAAELLVQLPYSRLHEYESLRIISLFQKTKSPACAPRHFVKRH